MNKTLLVNHLNRELKKGGPHKGKILTSSVWPMHKVTYMYWLASQLAHSSKLVIA